MTCLSVSGVVPLEMLSSAILSSLKVEGFLGTRSQYCSICVLHTSQLYMACLLSFDFGLGYVAMQERQGGPCSVLLHFVVLSGTSE